MLTDLVGLQGVVDADARRLTASARCVRRAGLGQEAAEGVLGVDPGLDRVALERDVVLGDASGSPVGDAQLQLDEVERSPRDPHDLLGDRVLDLEAGVHLEEVELAGGVVEQELDGAGAGVADLLGEGDGRARDRRALLLG